MRNNGLVRKLSASIDLTQSKIVSLDEINKKIVRLLRQNGRVSNVEISKRVGLSPPPCLRRLKLLEKEKVITGYRAQVNYKKLGYEVSAILTVALNSPSSFSMNDFLLTMNELSNVLDVKKTIDGSVFIIFFVSKNLDDCNFFLKKYIQNNEQVKSYKLFILEN